MKNIPVFLSIYVDAQVTIGTLYIDPYALSHRYKPFSLSFMFTTMKFVLKKHVSALESIPLVAKVPGCGFNIVHLLLDWEMIWTFTLNMDWSQDFFLGLRLACSLSPPLIGYGGLPLSTSWLSVSTAEILYCSTCNWTYTVFTSFSFAVDISVVATKLVSPQYIFVRDILYHGLYSIILILSASGNLCH